MKPGKTGITRILNAIVYSAQGLCYAWRHEAAFRQELILALGLFITAIFLSNSVIEYLILIFPVFIVLIVELINSAIEAVVDRISDEKHVLSGAAKDIGSAAVFVSLVLLIVVWGVTIFSKIFA